MQIGAVCNIFCVKHLRTTSNHQNLIDEYHECVKPIIAVSAQSTEFRKKLAKQYGRGLIELSNKLQSELKDGTDKTQKPSSLMTKIRHTLLRIAFLTDQCLVKLQHALKLKQWSIEKMWNNFLCRAVQYKQWDIVHHECDIFIQYLRSLQMSSASNQQLSDYIYLLTCNLHNKARALLELNFVEHYAECMSLLQSATKECLRHPQSAWRVSYLDKTFRICHKIVTDYGQHFHHHQQQPQQQQIMEQELILRLKTLSCLFQQNRCFHDDNDENIQTSNNNNNNNNKNIGFWDVAHQYVDCVSAQYSAAHAIRFRKMLIEFCLSPRHAYALLPSSMIAPFISFCVDYIASVGNLGNAFKLDALQQTVLAIQTFVETLKHDVYKLVIEIAFTVSMTQRTFKSGVVAQHIAHCVRLWANLYTCLQTPEQQRVFHSHSGGGAVAGASEKWRLLAKCLRNAPFLTRLIDDTYVFTPPNTQNSRQQQQQVIEMVQHIVSCIEVLFKFWSHCNEEMLSKDKLKNAHHRLFDALISCLSIQQKYFIHIECSSGGVSSSLLSVDAILQLLRATQQHLTASPWLCEHSMFKTFSTKAYNIAVQIYNTHQHFAAVTQIMQLVQASCAKFNDDELLSKCDKMYEAASIKCDNIQLVYQQLAKRIGELLVSCDAHCDGNLDPIYKHLRFLVKYQTRARSSSSSNTPSRRHTSCISLIDMLSNVGVELHALNDSLVIKVLTHLLRLYQSSFTYNTTMQQLEILHTLLRSYFCKQRPMQRAMALLDLAKLVRVHQRTPTTVETDVVDTDTDGGGEEFGASDRDDTDADMDSEHLHTTMEGHDDDDDGMLLQGEDEFDEQVHDDPLQMLEEAIDVLLEVKNLGVDDEELEFEPVLHDVLAAAYLWRGICKREMCATKQAVQSQMDELNESILALSMNVSTTNNSERDRDDDDDDDDDEHGMQSMLRAMKLWCSLISKHCKHKCKCKPATTSMQCASCHQHFRDLVATVQYLQILADYMHLHRYVANEIFVLDHMIRLLSTMSNTLEWCREYRLLCLCWSGMAYLQFANSNASRQIFDELETKLLPSTPNLCEHVADHIKIIYAKYQVLSSEQHNNSSSRSSDAIHTLLALQQKFEQCYQRHKQASNGAVVWENMYLLATVKHVLAELQIKCPKVFVHENEIEFLLDVDPYVLAKDALARYISLVSNLDRHFTCRRRAPPPPPRTSYHEFVRSLATQKYSLVKPPTAAATMTTTTTTPAVTHTKLLQHYPSEFRLISAFLQCVQILAHNQCILHEPRIAAYHYKNGHKAAYNLVIYPQQKLFLMDLATLECKKNEWHKYEECVQQLHEMSVLTQQQHEIQLSPSLTRKLYGSLSKSTPYAPHYDTSMMRILFTQCTADAMRYKREYRKALREYEQCLAMITSLMSSNSSGALNHHHHHFVPLLKLQCNVKRKYAKCLLYVRDDDNDEDATLQQQQSLDVCLQVLESRSILDDLQIAKLKLCVAQCILLRLDGRAIMRTIWSGDAHTTQLQSILEQNNRQPIVDVTQHHISMEIEFAQQFDIDEIAMVLYVRQHLLQSLVILLHLNCVNPSLIKQVSFALALVYGLCNVDYTAMFLNMSQSVSTRRDALKQYAKQLQQIKQQWHNAKIARKKNTAAKAGDCKDLSASSNADGVSMTDLMASMQKLNHAKKKTGASKIDDYLSDEQYHILYSKWHHKVSAMKYHDERTVDYNNLQACYQLVQRMSTKFYSQTVQLLQRPWNCVCVAVDELLNMLLIAMITPSVKARKTATQITALHIAINRKSESPAAVDVDVVADNDDNTFVRNLTFENEEEQKCDDGRYNQLMQTMQKFFIEANASTHSGKECIGNEQIKQWWDTRHKLDDTLKYHLQSIESDIFGFFRCALLPNFVGDGQESIHILSNALIQAINDYIAKKTGNAYLPTCLVTEFERRKSPKTLLFQKLLQLMLICYVQQQQQQETTSDTVGGDALTVTDNEIKHGLSYILNFSDDKILSRLLLVIKDKIRELYNRFSTKLNVTVSEYQPLLLCLDDSLKHIPWENIPTLHAIVSTSVCRIPCLEFAALRVLEYSQYKQAQPHHSLLKYYFIINPKGDLKKTESRFERLLNEEWNGMKNQIPSMSEFRDGLQDNDVFLYVGHNGGEEFANCHKLQTFSVRAITFLMGCSSGLLRKKGAFESNGIANYYMITPCPIMVANLWDVTDKDIDQFSGHMLRKCVLKKKEAIDVAKAVNMSRSKCKLQYLNGAAPVCYGIPFHLFAGVC